MTFDSVASYYRRTGSLKQTTIHFNISMGKCRKILITTGDYSSPLSIQILKLLEQGLSEPEICEKLGKSKSTINSHIPYSKGAYLSDSPTQNAIRIRDCRKRKRDNRQASET